MLTPFTSLHNETSFNFVKHCVPEKEFKSKTTFVFVHLLIGNYQTENGIYQKGDGNYQTENGIYQIKVGSFQIANGIYQIGVGIYNIKVGIYQIVNGYYRIKVGSFQISDGSFQINVGIYQITNGTGASIRNLSFPQFVLLIFISGFYTSQAQ